MTINNFRLPVRSGLMTALVLGGSWLLEAQPTVPMNVVPSRAIGQLRVTDTAGAPNLLEGRELNQPQDLWVDVTRGILYVVDTRNNRVLGWRNPASAANGATADLVIGQTDLFSNTAGGPGTAISGGFRSPSGVVTDPDGNLYVADSGNNRILRFPNPLNQPADFIQPDMVIGQRSTQENRPNQGSTVPSDSSLALADFRQPIKCSMAFDAQRNLWVTDGYNNRVLRYPASALAQGRSGPSADLVLGNDSFTTVSPLQIFTQGALANRTFIYQPTGIAFDQRGRLYVRDLANAASRVLVWDIDRPLLSGREASRLIGVPTVAQGQVLPPVNEQTLGGYQDASNAIFQRGGLTVNIAGILVPDPPNNRIMRFDPYESWPPESQRVSPSAREAIGQNNFNIGLPNRGLATITSSSLRFPLAATFVNNELYVADSFNNRVIVLPLAGGVFGNATRLFGQDRFDQGAPNLVEGRELYFLDGFSQSTAFGNVTGLSGTCVAVDGDAVFVADAQNHRILGWRDIRRARGGDRADVVLGQPDFVSTNINFPTGDADRVTNTSLNTPTCVAVDANRNLWVADSGNGRLLRYPRLSDQPNPSATQPNLVLGQTSFTLKTTDATSRTMRFPGGIAFLSDGSVLASDMIHNRVLRFRRPAGGDFQNGQAADGVWGQANFTDSGRALGTELNRFNVPKGIATDAQDRLYVAEIQPGGQGRILIFSEANAPGTVANVPARQNIDRVGNPQSILVNKDTGDIWIAFTQNVDGRGTRVTRIPSFEQISLTGVINAEDEVAAAFPLGITLDRFGNLVVADSLNRISLYYPRMTLRNAANADRPTLAPYTYASIFGAPNAYGEITRTFDQEPNPIPMPTTVADVQVSFADRLAPIQFVSPAQINFIVPREAPTLGRADVLVFRASTGQILGAGVAQMDTVSPAVFAVGAGGRGQIAALNQDNSINSAQNPAQRGSIVTLFATGLGNIPGAPNDGVPVTSEIRTPGLLQISIGTAFVPADAILFSGLAPNLISVWQINVRIPMTVPPGNATPFGLRYRDTNAQTGLTVAVRQ